LLAVIVDVEATPARTYDEVAAARTMIERTEQRMGIKPQRLAADTAYGTGKFIGWSATLPLPRGSPPAAESRRSGGSSINACSGARKKALRGRNRDAAAGLFPRGMSQEDCPMKTVALGVAALLGLAIPASAGPNDQIQLAQASTQSNRGGSASQSTQGSTKEGSATQGSNAAQFSNREGSARSGDMRSSGNERREGHEGRREGSRTSVNIRAGERDGVRSRFSTSRTSIRTRVGGSDDVVIRRKNAKRYVYGEPSTTVIKKKKKVRRYVQDEPSIYLKRKKKVRSYVYDDPSTTVIRRHRPGVAVGVGVSTRTSVRGESSRTSVRERGERNGTSVNLRGSTITRTGTSSGTDTKASTSSQSGQAGTPGGTQGRGGNLQSRPASSGGGASGSTGTSGTSGGQSGGASGTKQ
jgi:hypothetical protein